MNRRETAWDTWCPNCKRYWVTWTWEAEGTASDYNPKRKCLWCGCYVERNMRMLKVTCSVCGKEQHASESNPTGWFSIHHGGRQIHRLCSYGCLMEAVMLEVTKNRKGEAESRV